MVSPHPPPTKTEPKDGPGGRGGVARRWRRGLRRPGFGRGTVGASGRERNTRGRRLEHRDRAKTGADGRAAP